MTRVSKASIKAVVFDAGGVLVLESPDREKYRLYKEFHKNPEYDRLNIGKISLNEMWKSIEERGTLSDGDLEQLKAYVLKKRLFNKVLFNFAQTLKKRGIIIGICSNNALTVFDTWNKKFRFTKGFGKNVVVSAMVKMIKPKSAIFRYLAKTVGARPNEIIFIDDRAENVKGAKKLGMHGLHYKGNNQAIIKGIESRLIK